MLDELKAHLDREPFSAFRIILTSGDRYEVTSPYQVAIGQTLLFYCFPRSNRTAFLRMNRVAAFEDSEPAKS
jgi:hypothetical protein